MGRTRRTTAALAGAALALALVAGACSSDDGDDAAVEADEPSTTAEETTTSTASVNAGATVEITEFSFDPSPVDIAAGESVTWENAGASRHTVTAVSDPTVDPLFKSPPVQPEATFVQVFNEPGTYEYFCSIHPDLMQGTITVS